jgi:hypothetical protein
MARYAIVVKDAEKTRAFHASRLGRTGTDPQAGDVHTEMDDGCPNGLPNCRDCGDPDHAATCLELGHCPDCGTKHGIAPDSVLAKHGFTLEPR